MQSFGEYMRTKRAELGLTLRQFCINAELDPAYVSRVERDRRPAPSDQAMLKKWAVNLKINLNSQDWELFSDLASLSAGRVPSDILTDAELADKLPMLFRTLRSDQPNEVALKEIVEIVRRG